MVTVTVSELKHIVGQPHPERVNQEEFEYFTDEDIEEFAKKVNTSVFEKSQNSEEVLIYYRTNFKSNSRHIMSKSIRYQDDKNIIRSRILSDLKEVLKKDE